MRHLRTRGVLVRGPHRPDPFPVLHDHQNFRRQLIRVPFLLGMPEWVRIGPDVQLVAKLVGQVHDRETIGGLLDRHVSRKHQQAQVHPSPDENVEPVHRRFLEVIARARLLSAPEKRLLHHRAQRLVVRKVRGTLRPRLLVVRR